ncbi:hypothetical protein ACH4TX_16495 [Streptomyces sp. NPDC021098]|uniref:hypothetical protein n=1 Tax=unclassified Streptomyces TaxID=2593676 RepID=UPI0037BD581E
MQRQLHRAVRPPGQVAEPGGQPAGVPLPQHLGSDGALRLLLKAAVDLAGPGPFADGSSGALIG